MKRIAVGITGASGAPLAHRLVSFLLEAGHEVHVTASGSGRLVVNQELGRDDAIGTEILPGIVHDNLHEWSAQNYNAPFASGSAAFDGMVICPCSMATVGAVACGITDNLLRRGADVMLKERRPMILVPREAPLSEIHLRNLLTVVQAGATVIPPILTFYQSPTDTVREQVDFVVSRVLDHLKVDNQLYQRWGQES